MALILFPFKDPLSQAVMLFTSLNLYDCTYRPRLGTSQSVLTQASIEGGRIPGEAPSPWLLNIVPSRLLVVYLSLIWILLEKCLWKSLRALASPWPLLRGTSDEEEHFICLCSRKRCSSHWPVLVINNPNDF